MVLGNRVLECVFNLKIFSMMRYFGVFLVSMFICTGSVFAQPSLGFPSFPGAGYSSTLSFGEYLAPSPPDVEPQTWDFSDVNGTVLSNLELVPAGTSPFAPMFDGAEWVSINGDQVAFWAVLNGDFTVLGNANNANGVTVPFLDPLVQRSFPMELGNTLSDTFSANQMLFGLPYSLDGNATSSIDAWGSLTMPDGTVYPEVLRMDYFQYYAEAYDGDTANWSLSQVMYFAPEWPLPMFLHEELLVTDNAGEELLAFTDVAWYSSPVASAASEKTDFEKLAFPNPVVQGELLHWTLPAGCYWKVMSLSGQVIEHGVVTSQERKKFDTSTWDAGLVLLVPLTAEGRAMGQVQRVVIQQH